MNQQSTKANRKAIAQNAKRIRAEWFANELDFTWGWKNRNRFIASIARMFADGQNGARS